VVIELKGPGAAIHPDEPPLAPPPGPSVKYAVRAGETMKSIAKRTLGSMERWGDIHKLNPTLPADGALPVGLVICLPGDACVQEDGEAVKPLPLVRTRQPLVKARPILPLTGTFQLTLDDKGGLSLPKAIREQLGNCETVMVSPGTDKCLWLTNQAHLDRLARRLEHSPAREAEVHNFRRLYYAQAVKTGVGADGRVTISERLAQFAGLHQEVVLVGIDDHFEVWDAARWRNYTQQTSARPGSASHD
jgi:MraZ protein